MSSDLGRQAVGGSFRDPSGIVYTDDGMLFRQVNKSYQGDYSLLMDSGLYEELTCRGLLIPHEEVDAEPLDPVIHYKTIRPEPLSFISYPYEWCFSQLKDAALATLELMKAALAHGMVLKDASAFNIQFRGMKPVLMDTLSFEAYVEGEPWIAYRQFCQHFLAPLALMAKVDVRLNGMLRQHIDGIPLDLASRLLPKKTFLSLGLASHIHLHAKSQLRYGARRGGKIKSVRKHALLGLIDSLESTVSSLKWSPGNTSWADYYSDVNYDDASMKQKTDAVKRFIDEVAPATCWDLGANTGRFSRLATGRGIDTLSMDVDPSCVESNYLASVKAEDTCMHPLLTDLTNPSPSLGWDHGERDSLIGRGPCDLALVLALIHHLAIAGNLPFSRISSFLARVGRHMVIEYVPKTDSRAQLLLSRRKDIFYDYDLPGFKREFGRNFEFLDEFDLEGSDRILFLMKNKEKI
ncbi:SAM-dependent methyltransferase [Candidatus Altiarchaeota archaeon]